jgi:hypothetical protein
MQRVTYGDLYDIIFWCKENFPDEMVYPKIGYIIAEVYENVTKDKHPAKCDYLLISDLEKLKLKWFGLDEIMIDYNRWYKIHNLFD